MKARKINLENYKVASSVRGRLLDKILTTPGVEPCLRDAERWRKEELDNLLSPGPMTQDYDVKGSIINVLFALSVSGREAWEKRDPLCKKIQIHSGHVFLDKDEYEMLLRAFNKLSNPGRNEEELLKRIFEAEEVEMEEKKETKK